MATVSVSDRINVPVEQAFRLFTDFEPGAGRVSNIKQIEMLTQGPVRLGTRWRETRQASRRPTKPTKSGELGDEDTKRERPDEPGRHDSG